MGEIGRIPVERTSMSSARQPATTGGQMGHPLLGLRDEVDRLFDDFFRGWPSLASLPGRMLDFDPFRRAAEPLMTTNGALAPNVDVAETDDGYEITADLPGLDEKDIAVSVSDGVLTIKGEKRAERQEKRKDYYLAERSYGAMQRSFRLPDTVDPEKISAEYRKGVLTVNLPRSKEAKSRARSIEVKAR
jgi:HSP20 family protein